MNILAGLIVALGLTATACGQCYYVPVQCYGGCQPCQPYCQPCQPAYPSQQPAPSQPATPQYEVRPTQPTSPPAAPPAAQPTQPTIDQQAWLDWVAEQRKQHEGDKSYQEKSLLIMQQIQIAIENQQNCQCPPTDLKPVLDGQAKIIEAIKGIKVDVPPPVQTPTMPGEQHIVVVADHNSPYWPRLSEKLTTARKTYSGIQDTTLPAFPIGVHPQAVVYRDKVPVRIVKGQYEVEDLLSRASRGESL